MQCQVELEQHDIVASKIINQNYIYYSARLAILIYIHGMPIDSFG